MGGEEVEVEGDGGGGGLEGDDTNSEVMIGNFITYDKVSVSKSIPLIFLLDFTLFVIDMHQKRSISLFQYHLATFTVIHFPDSYDRLI